MAQQAPPPPAAGGAAPAGPMPLRIVSWNVRVDDPADGPFQWKNRVSQVHGLLRYQRADVICLQEVLANQLQDLTNLLPEYGVVGVGRDNGTNGGEYGPIFYRKDHYDAVVTRNVWLSQTPDIPGSKSWDAVAPQLATVAVFRARDGGKEFLVVNTRLDEQSESARVEGVKVLITEMMKILTARDIPFFVIGDLNSTDYANAYKILSAQMDDTAKTAKHVHHEFLTTTIGHWNTDLVPNMLGVNESTTDFVFARRGTHVGAHGVTNVHFFDVQSSDHRPVIVELII